MQPLKWANLHFDYDDEYRLDVEMDKDGKITRSSVRYECEKCGGTWTNADKDYFLPRGEWRPTATPRRPGMRSYHVPGLLSPVGFRSWESGVMDFLDIKAKGKPPAEMQIWVNTFLGEPFIDETERPRIEAILTRERRYFAGTLPEEADPVFCTIGADVQGDRIECEVVAWGRGKESWSIAYHVLSGDTSDLESEAWQAFRELIETEHAGMTVNLAAVDAGYRSDVVYEFADSFDSGVHPVMGSDVLSQNRQYIKLMPVKGRQTGRIDINTNILKQEIYRYLNREWIPGKTQRDGYCHFPADYTRQHYLQLTAESTTTDKNGRMIFNNQGRRNEQLDCRVYALASLYALKSVYEESIGTELSWPDFWDYVAPREGDV
jgi:phage terminase large subunit GpA-like protein